VKAGDVLDGRYRLLSPIGEGGMGVVWRARQIPLDADVAIKLLHAQTARHPGALNRFKREANAAAVLRSPHVVQVVDCGVDEATGTAFIAMELLDGESLSARLSRKTRLSAEETSRWITHAARALTRAHAAGIIHRDLKPANIFIVHNEDDELAKVLDFGIAKLAGQQRTVTATASGAILGTPHYMSPEQIDPTRDVDFRADLWSLAVIACECLTGRRPFEGDTLASLAMKIALSRSELPSSLGPVPRGFDAWFARGTDVNPERRFGSALDLAATLRQVVESGGVMHHEPAEAPLQPTTRQDLTPSVLGVLSRAATGTEDPGKRRPWLRGAAIAAVALLLAGTGALWGSSRNAAAPRGALDPANGERPTTGVASLRASGSAARSLDADAGVRAAPGSGHVDGSPAGPERARSPTIAPVPPAAPHGVASAGTVPSTATARGAAQRPHTSTRRRASTKVGGSPSSPPKAAPAVPPPSVDPYDLP
jgi:eukaryotic-like serine/threonine-protein kinase